MKAMKQLTASDIQANKQSILAAFEDYMQACIREDIPIRFINRLGDVEAEDENTSKSLLQWGDVEGYIAADREATPVFTTDIIFPALERALILKARTKRTYRADAGRSNIDHVLISPRNTTSHGRTSYFS